MNLGTILFEAHCNYNRPITVYVWLETKLSVYITSSTIHHFTIIMICNQSVLRVTHYVNTSYYFKFTLRFIVLVFNVYTNNTNTFIIQLTTKLTVTLLIPNNKLWFS